MGFRVPLVTKKIGKFEYGRAEKALFPKAWRHTKQGLVLRACNQDCNGMAQAKCALLIWQKYITENTKSKWDDRKRNTETGKLATKLQGCANYLVFKRYLTVDEVRLHAANFCKKHLLCPFCAMRRGAKYLQVYKQRLDVVFTGKPEVTRVHGYADCERRRNLSSGSRICVRLSRSIRSSAGMLSKVKSRSNMQSAAGGVMSIEVKRGRNLVYGTLMFI